LQDSGRICEGYDGGSADDLQTAESTQQFKGINA